jgi:flagellar motor switch protein FliM
VQSPAAAGIDGTAGVRIRSHDFRLAGRLSEPQITTITTVHEAFARRAADALAAQTRAPVHILLRSVRQVTGQEFRDTLNHAVLLAGVALEPLGGVALLTVDQRVAFSLIDRLLGGQGVPSVPARELSEIEQSVVENGIAGLLPHLQSAWEPVIRIQPRLEYCQRGDHAAALPSPAAMLVRVTFATNIGGVEGAMELAIPCLALRSIGDRRAGRHPLPPRGAQQRAGRRSTLQEALADVRVTITAEIGSTQLPLPRVLALAEGDLIRLDQDGPRRELCLKVAGRPKFRCLPGVVGKRLAVQVVKQLDGAVEVAR